MSEEAAKAAFERRRPAATPNADAAKAAFETATDVFTTCQKCGKRVGARPSDTGWEMVGHDCS